MKKKKKKMRTIPKIVWMNELRIERKHRRRRRKAAGG
jgi:hypothetical protein